MSSYGYLDVCRLCLTKEGVSMPIFEGQGTAQQIFHKISFCMPVKITREDKLPQKICNQCVYKLDLFYAFCDQALSVDKELHRWLDDVNKQGYAVLNQSEMKGDQNNENRLDGSVMQQVSGHQSSMNMGMDNMGVCIPMMIPSSNQQQITSVPMDTNGSSVQNVQAVTGSSLQITHDQITQTQTNASTQHEEEEESSEDEENSDDECEGDDGLPIKEESEEDPNNSRTIEPTTFVNVSLACEDPGPSGLQQQKMPDIQEMTQATDVDPKTGSFVSQIAMLPGQQPNPQHQCVPADITHVFAPVNAQLVLVSTDPLHMPEMEQVVLNHESSIVMQCEFCGVGFMTEQALHVHLETLHSNDATEQLRNKQSNAEQLQLDELLVCEHCGCSFSTTPELREHQKEHGLDDEAFGDEIIAGDDEWHTCDKCVYKTTCQESLARHQRCHTPVECKTCGDIFSDTSQEHQLSEGRDNSFQCDVCNATFRYHQGLRLHTKLHQPDYVEPKKKHHCELCNKRFSRRQVLLVHMKTHGSVSSQNEHVCPICRKAVSSKNYLTVHLRKHTGEKPHVCDLCGKRFISQNYLSVHRRTHTGERPHRCTHCNKSFTQRTTLVVHVRSHTGDRPYHCTKCDKSFTSKTTLNSHLKTHAKQNARQQQRGQQQQEQQHQEQMQQ